MEVTLDLEGATREQIEGARKDNGDYHTQFVRKLLIPCIRFELHERVVKPRLNLQDSILEIGVGTGPHLLSYQGLNYTGLEVSKRIYEGLRKNITSLGINSKLIRRLDSKKLPFQSNNFGNIFTVCTLHEYGSIERELAEIDIVLKPNGNFVAIERLCAAGESAQAIRNLKREPDLFESFFSKRGYTTSLDRFKASYFGESLSSGPRYNFFVFSAKKG